MATFLQSTASLSVINNVAFTPDEILQEFTEKHTLISRSLISKYTVRLLRAYVLNDEQGDQQEYLDEVVGWKAELFTKENKRKVVFSFLDSFFFHFEGEVKQEERGKEKLDFFAEAIATITQSYTEFRRKLFLPVKLIIHNIESLSQWKLFLTERMIGAENDYERKAIAQQIEVLLKEEDPSDRSLNDRLLMFIVLLIQEKKVKVDEIFIAIEESPSEGFALFMVLREYLRKEVEKIFSPKKPEDFQYYLTSTIN